MVNSPPWPVKISNMMDEEDQTAYGEHSQKGCLPRILQSYHGYVEFSCPVPANIMISTVSGRLHYIYAQRLRAERVAEERTMGRRCHLQMCLGELTRTSAKASHKLF